MRRSELALVAGGLALVAGAGLLGTLNAPAGDAENRPSVRAAGPGGLRALPEVLRRVGVTPGERTVALFDLARSSPTGDTVLALFSSPLQPTAEEVRALHAWVRRGGKLLSVGSTAMVECLGYEIDLLAPPGIPSLGGLPDLRVPGAALRRPDADAGRGDPRPRPRRTCAPVAPVEQTVLLAVDDDTIAIRQRYAGGGEVVLVADVQLLSNRVLKEHALGLDALQWLLAMAPRVVMFDEYHQGYGERASLFGATFRYVRTTPAGWALMQLAAAGLLLLAISAVRFGPPVAVVERRRRQPLEHLDALASGLERGRAGSHARLLLALGLRRRLNPLAPPRETRVSQWLAALERGARSDAARGAVHRLRRSLDQPGDGKVLEAALLVEEVWETLKAPAPRR